MGIGLEDGVQYFKMPNALHITRKCHPYVHVYKLKRQVLDPLHSAKYLGAYLSNDLRWNEHVKTISNKANKTLGFLKRTLVMIIGVSL